MIYNILLLKRQYLCRFLLENVRLTAVTREYSTYRNFDYNYLYCCTRHTRMTLPI